MIEIRAVGSDDAMLLARVADDVFDAPIRPNRLAAYLADPAQAIVVAIADGEVIGQARGAMVRNPDEADSFVIDNLGVAPDWQRRGIATQLIGALEAVALARGCASIWVTTEPDNLPANALYSIRTDAASVAYYEWRL